MAASGLRCCVAGFFSSCGEQGLLFTVRGLLIVVVSLLGEHGLSGARAPIVVVPGLWSTGSVVVVARLRCPVACGIFPDQGSNPYLLHWQADSLPVSRQGSPRFSF